MRVVAFLSLFLMSLLGVGQDLNKKLENISNAVDDFYKTSQPYSMVLNTRSAHYQNDNPIPGTSLNKQYKLVMGSDFNYMYLKTSQVFKDSVGELIIDNQKRIIEFNTFRKGITFGPGESILQAVKELGVSIKDIKHVGDKIILLFTNQAQDIEVEYIIVDNKIVSSIHKNFGENKVLMYSLKTTYTDFKPKLTECDKYKMQGHGYIENDDFVPNEKYKNYEIFNY